MSHSCWINTTLTELQLVKTVWMLTASCWCNLLSNIRHLVKLTSRMDNVSSIYNSSRFSFIQCINVVKLSVTWRIEILLLRHTCNHVRCCQSNIGIQWDSAVRTTKAQRHPPRSHESPSSGTDTTPTVRISILQHQTQKEHSRGMAKDKIIPLWQQIVQQKASDMCILN